MGELDKALIEERKQRFSADVQRHIRRKGFPSTAM